MREALIDMISKLVAECQDVGTLDFVYRVLVENCDE